MNIKTENSDFGNGNKVMFQTVEHGYSGEIEYFVEVEEDYETVSEYEFDEDYFAAKEYFYLEIQAMKERLQK